MAYSEPLAERVREALGKRKDITEKKMMGGLTFMVNSKMCAGILKDDLMVRLDPNVYETALKKKGCRPMDFTSKPMQGFVFIGSKVTASKKDMKYWLDLALDFNKRAKASKKRT